MDWICSIMDWICSILAIITIWLMGDKDKIAPIFGIVTEIAWFLYLLSIKQYGLLLAIVVFGIIHFRNALKWGSFK